MSDEEAATLQCGDFVRIRSWEDMASEYDSDSDGINIPLYFSDAMGSLCGKEFKVLKLRKYVDGTFVNLKNEVIEKDGVQVILDGEANNFLISAEMLESREAPFDEDEIQTAFQNLI